jgi:multicomponent Na+:H+ antiporter subunit F
MNLILIPMLVALLMPIYEACKDSDIWQKMLAFSSVASKSAIIILVVAVWRDDWMIGVAGVIILSVGNAGLMLLAQIMKRMNDVIHERTGEL